VVVSRYPRNPSLIKHKWSAKGKKRTSGREGESNLLDDKKVRFHNNRSCCRYRKGKLFVFPFLVVAVVVDADLVLVVVIVTRRIGRSNSERTRRGNGISRCRWRLVVWWRWWKERIEEMRVSSLFFSCKLVPMDLSKVC